MLSNTHSYEEAIFVYAQLIDLFGSLAKPVSSPSFRPSSWFDLECHKEKKILRSLFRESRTSNDSDMLKHYFAQKKSFQAVTEAKKKDIF